MTTIVASPFSIRLPGLVFNKYHHSYQQPVSYTICAACF